MKFGNQFIIFFSFMVGFLLSIVKFPVSLNYFCPAWIPLIVCYWILAVPHHVGIGTAWTCGIVLDIFNNTLLGQHAFSLALIAYLILKLHRQIRVFPVWQQAATIFILITIYQFELFWVQGIIGNFNNSWLFLLPAIMSALLWPFTITAFRMWRIRFRFY